MPLPLKNMLALNSQSLSITPVKQPAKEMKVNLGVSLKALISPRLLSGFAGKSQEENARTTNFQETHYTPIGEITDTQSGLTLKVVACSAPKISLLRAAFAGRIHTESRF